MKTLMVFLHGIGDCIMFTPALKFYKEKHSSDEISVLCLKLTEELWKSNHLVKNVFVSSYFKNPPSHGNIIQYIFERIKIQKEINWIKQKYGIDKVIYIVPWSIRLFNISIPLPGKLRRLPLFYKLEDHEVLKLCKHLQVNDNKTWPYDFKQTIFISDKHRKKASGIIKNLGTKKPICIMHTSASSGNKSLSEKEAEGIINYLKSKGIGVILINSNLNFKKVKKINSDSVLLSAALIEYCDLFIGIDSGPAHIAEVLNKPSIVIAKAFRTELLYIKKDNSLLLDKYDYNKITKGIDDFLALSF